MGEKVFCQIQVWVLLDLPLGRITKRYNWIVMISAGYEELDHTADWALRVWAETLPDLLRTAARGMYALSGVQLGDRRVETVTVLFSLADHEMLLVDFLSELVFLGERGLGAGEVTLTIAGDVLEGELGLAPIEGQKKEIKAVTYHGLRVKASQVGYEATIVFDV